MDGYYYKLYHTIKKTGSIYFPSAIFFLVGFGSVIILFSSGRQMLNRKRPCR